MDSVIAHVKNTIITSSIEGYRRMARKIQRDVEKSKRNSIYVNVESMVEKLNQMDLVVRDAMQICSRLDTGEVSLTCVLMEEYFCFHSTNQKSPYWNYLSSKYSETRQIINETDNSKFDRILNWIRQMKSESTVVPNDLLAKIYSQICIEMLKKSGDEAIRFLKENVGEECRKKMSDIGLILLAAMQKDEKFKYREKDLKLLLESTEDGSLAKLLLAELSSIYFINAVPLINVLVVTGMISTHTEHCELALDTNCSLCNIPFKSFIAKLPLANIGITQIRCDQTNIKIQDPDIPIFLTCGHVVSKNHSNPHFKCCKEKSKRKPIYII